MDICTIYTKNLHFIVWLIRNLLFSVFSLTLQSLKQGDSQQNNVRIAIHSDQLVYNCDEPAFQRRERN